MDIVVVACGIMPHVKECKLIEIEKIVPCYHRGYLIDMDIAF